MSHVNCDLSTYKSTHNLSLSQTRIPGRNPRSGNFTYRAAQGCRRLTVAQHGTHKHLRTLLAGGGIDVEILEEHLRETAGFDIKPTQSAICAVMLYDAPLSQKFAAKMAEEGIFVTGFYYPVVPKGQARIRVQQSAAHEKQHLEKAIAAFVKVGKELGVIK